MGLETGKGFFMVLKPLLLFCVQFVLQSSVSSLLHNYYCVSWEGGGGGGVIHHQSVLF